MNWNESRLTEIARRRERLVARAAAQRAAIAGTLRELRPPIDIVDRGLAVVRFFRRHPVLLAAVTAAAFAFRPRGMLWLAGRGLAAWRVWRAVSALSARLLA